VTSTPRPGEDALRRRKLLVAVVIGSAFLLLLSFNAGSWLFLRHMGRHLDKELGRRLSSMATLAMRLLDEEQVEALFSTERSAVARLLLEPSLAAIDRENQLEGAFIVDRDHRIVASSRDIFLRGQAWTFFPEDSLALRKGWRGEVAVSPLHLIEGHPFKSAYAPLRDRSDRVRGLLILDASAEFFQLRRQFQRGLVVGGVVSLGLFVLFAMFAIWALKGLLRAEASLRRSERLAVMGQMAAMVAHEIRNPLGIIKTTSDVLKSRYSQPDHPDELFDYIPGEVRRLNALINDFLSLSKEPELHPEIAPIEEVIHRTLTGVERDLAANRVEMKVHLPENLPPVRHDKKAMGQVLLNLVLNAIQAINGKGTVSVSAHPTRKKGKTWLVLQVCDTGGGIEGDPERIFEPFYTTKETGTGLGLTLSRRLVEKHGGWMEVESRKGEGTTVRVYLPI